MASVVPLTLNEGNDEEVDLTVTPDIPIDPVSATFELLIKTSADEPDNAATTVTGAGITVHTTSPSTSISLTAKIPATDLATPGTMFWRLDVIVAGERHTAIYGPLKIRNL